MAKGDEKTVDVTFPADWRVAQLAGKSAQVHVKIEQVSEQVLPEADEAFIRSFGVKSGGLEQFRTDIRSNLERELKGALMNRLRRAVRSEEHTSELQSLMRISYAVFCLKKKKNNDTTVLIILTN